MNKADIIASMSTATGLTKKDCDAAVCAFTAAVKDALKGGEKVSIPGLGAFETKTRPARMGRNPMTGEMREIPEKTVPIFKAGKSLRDLWTAK